MDKATNPVPRDKEVAFSMQSGQGMKLAAALRSVDRLPHKVLWEIYASLNYPGTWHDFKCLCRGR